jgi:hypothetical protein
MDPMYCLQLHFQQMLLCRTVLIPTVSVKGKEKAAIPAPVLIPMSASPYVSSQHSTIIYNLLQVPPRQCHSRLHQKLNKLGAVQIAEMLSVLLLICVKEGGIVHGALVQTMVSAKTLRQELETCSGYV